MNAHKQELCAFLDYYMSRVEREDNNNVNYSWQRDYGDQFFGVIELSGIPTQYVFTYLDVEDLHRTMLRAKQTALYPDQQAIRFPLDGGYYEVRFGEEDDMELIER